MKRKSLPEPDRNHIIQALPDQLSEESRQMMKQFGTFAFIYDFSQDRLVRPRIHKADPQRHREIWGDLLFPITESRILDVACGTGGTIPHIDESNAYTGLDLSYAMLKRAVKKARRKNFRRAEFIHGNAEKLQFKKNSFDVVIMDTALHMIPDYKQSIAEIARVLRKNGVFFCSAPVVGIYTQFDENWQKVSAKRSLHSITVRDIQETCSSCGLEFIQIDKNGGVLYF